jgi:hypothetical protein
MLIFVAKILWSTTHAPQNAYFGAPQKRFSLLVLYASLQILLPWNILGLFLLFVLDQNKKVVSV